jgi:dihydroorotase
MYDLLLKGGHVMDPANSLNAVRDVAVTGGKIAAVGENIPASRARKSVDVSGFYVTPGFIDIHVHVSNLSPTRVYPPADMNLSSGLTTIVDAGTWGADNFHLLRKNLMENSEIRLLAWLNIVRSGMGDDRQQDVKQLDSELCAEVIRKNRDVIVGVKTAHYWTGKPWDKEHPPWAAVDRAVEAGKLADVPIMVDFWPRPPERSYEDLILNKLRPGDIHTHVFAQQFPIIVNGKLNQALIQARNRGVIFDLGHGAGSFWFRNAVPAIQQGFVPDSISTDLHMGNVNGPVVDMITTMSKVLAMGVPLEEVIRRSTVNPAKEIHRPELGTLTVGRDADIAVVELRHGKFGYTDCGRAKMIGDVKLENRMTLRAGRIAYDPTGVSTVTWEKAPKQYFTTPKLQGVDPSASADPTYRPWREEQ